MNMPILFDRPLAPTVGVATDTLVNNPEKETARRMANSILRRVDHLIKSAEIDHAIREIIQAKEIDPTNAYVYAYEERLAFLKTEHEKHVVQERTRMEAAEAARERDEQHRKEMAIEQQLRKEEWTRKEAEQKSIERISGQRELTATTVWASSLPVGTSPALKQPHTRKSGTLEHCGVRNLAGALSQPENSAGLSSPAARQESPGLETHPHSSATINDSIFVIDDDLEMLRLVAEMLRLNGYDVTPFATSDEAYALLKTCRPNMILSDIDLPSSSLGGFSFFEKIQEINHLSDVPFVFITGLADDLILQKGKELGVDDYLVKPISETELLATVKGKLKRYAQVQGAYYTNSSTTRTIG